MKWIDLLDRFDDPDQELIEALNRFDRWEALIEFEEHSLLLKNQLYNLKDSLSLKDNSREGCTFLLMIFQIGINFHLEYLAALKKRGIDSTVDFDMENNGKNKVRLH